MPEADFFRRLGVFTIEEFLDPDSYNAIQAEMGLSQLVEPAQVSRDGVERVDEAIRNTKLVKVSDETYSLLEKHLAALKPRLEDHFGVELDDSEEPHFLTYRTGDFFKPHTDSSTSCNAHGYIRHRRVSVVLFLSGELSTTDSGDYTGGSLILYGLIKNPLWENYGFKVCGKPGLLIAFASDVYHEVTTVTKGMRCTMVSWFPAREIVHTALCSRFS